MEDGLEIIEKSGFFVFRAVVQAGVTENTPFVLDKGAERKAVFGLERKKCVFCLISFENPLTLLLFDRVPHRSRHHSHRAGRGRWHRTDRLSPAVDLEVADGHPRPEGVRQV